jgi:hypothetical protein
LNPDLPREYRDEGWVFDGVAEVCGRAVAEQLWQAWRRGRNKVFHYDIAKREYISRIEAEQRVTGFLEAMMAAMACERQAKRD